MKPGATIRPRASKVLSALLRILLGAASSATRPSRKSKSMDASSFAAGSMTRPPLIKREPALDLSCAIHFSNVPQRLSPKPESRRSLLRPEPEA